MLNTLHSELRLAARRLIRRPAFAGIVWLILVLSVGANVAVFSIVNALWLKPRGFPDAGRVVMLLGSDERGGKYATLYWDSRGLDAVSRNQAFEGVAGQVPTAGELASNRLEVRLSGRGPLEALAVTHNYFEVLRVAVQGRTLAETDEQLGSPLVGIISHDLWLQHFRGAPDVVGRIVESGTHRVEVVGIAAPGFRGARAGERVDLWVPRTATSRLSGGSLGQADPNLLAVARLKVGVSVAQAQRGLAESKLPFEVKVTPIDQLYGSPSSATLSLSRQPVIWAAVIAAGIVLLAGCVSLMAVTRAYYDDRAAEFRLALALGCPTRALLRQLSIELSLLVLAGAMGAVAAARLLIIGAPAIRLPGGIDLSRLDLGTDWSVVGVALIAASATTSLSAASALRRVVHSRQGYLQRVAGERLDPVRSRSLLLAIQVAVATVVLMGAGTFVTSVIRGRTVGPGFDADNLLFVEFIHKTAGGRAMTKEERSETERLHASNVANLLDQLLGVPGVRQVDIGQSPIDVEAATAGITPRNVWIDNEQRSVRLSFLEVGVAYRQVLGLTLVAGRDLAREDIRLPAEPREHPVLISASASRLLFGDHSPLGRTFGLSQKYHFLVVGIVSDFAVGSQTLGHRSAVIVPIDPARTARSHRLAVTIRTDAAPDRLRDRVQDSVVKTMPNAAALAMSSGSEVVNRDLGRDRLGAWFFSSFGLISLGLGAFSVFGLVAQLLTSRRKEFGVRLALGGTQHGMSRLLIVGGLWPVCCGIAVGSSISLVAGVALRSVLGIGGAFEPITLLITVCLMLGAAFLSALLATTGLRLLNPADILRT